MEIHCSIYDVQYCNRIHSIHHNVLTSYWVSAVRKEHLEVYYAAICSQICIDLVTGQINHSHLATLLHADTGFACLNCYIYMLLIEVCIIIWRLIHHQLMNELLMRHHVRNSSILFFLSGFPDTNCEEVGHTYVKCLMFLLSPCLEKNTESPKITFNTVEW